MKKFFSYIFLMSILAGCISSQPTTPTKVIAPTGTATPYPTLTATRTAIPTGMPEIIMKTCVEIKTEIPRDDIDGLIVLNSAFLFFDKSVGHYVRNPGTAYLWDIKNDTKTEIYHQNGEELNAFSVSPDHKSLVYGAGNADNTSQRVTVVDGNGKIIRNVVDAHNWFSPIGWMDNEHLAIWVLSDTQSSPPFPTLIYNPFTKDYKFYNPDYPNIYFWHLPFWDGTLTAYDPSISLVLYPVMGHANAKEGIALWDIQSKQKIAFLPLASPHAGEVRQPIWSPDGQKFVIGAILEDHRTLDLYVVNRTGEIQQLTHFEDLIKRGEIESSDLWSYSLSDDGRFIAFWYRISGQHGYQLAVVDTFSGKTRDLCITNQNPESVVPPVWSPGNTQILISRFANESETPEDYRVVLIDIQDNYAVEIAKGFFPEGWLTTP